MSEGQELPDLTRTELRRIADEFKSERDAAKRDTMRAFDERNIALNRITDLERRLADATAIAETRMGLFAKANADRESAERALAEARKLVTGLEWSGDCCEGPSKEVCAQCRASKREWHRKDCKLIAFLAGTDGAA